MKKLTKQLLTGVIALGILAPVATTAINPINTTVNAKRHHRRHASITTNSPVPRHHRRARRSYWHKGVPEALVPSNKVYAFKSHGHLKAFMSRKGMGLINDGGAATSYDAGAHPHYRYLSHHNYHIVGKYENFYIKKHGNHYYIRDDGSYIGNCYRTRF